MGDGAIDELASVTGGKAADAEWELAQHGLQQRFQIQLADKRVDPAIFPFMPLIHTCELNGVPSLGYLIALQKYARQVPEQPAAWMPWNYRDTLARTAEV